MSTTAKSIPEWEHLTRSQARTIRTERYRGHVRPVGQIDVRRRYGCVRLVPARLSC